MYFYAELLVYDKNLKCMLMKDKYVGQFYRKKVLTLLWFKPLSFSNKEVGGRLEGNTE
jgi:hypothetical protein